MRTEPQGGDDALARPGLRQAGAPRAPAAGGGLAQGAPGVEAHERSPAPPAPAAETSWPVPMLDAIHPKVSGGRYEAWSPSMALCPQSTTLTTILVAQSRVGAGGLRGGVDRESRTVARRAVEKAM